MSLKDYINFENYNISDSELLNITEKDLDDIFLKDEPNKYNLFFVLLNKYYDIKKRNTNLDNNKLSHVCYLISYYLFVLATPIASYELALVYAEKSFEYLKSNNTQEWLNTVKDGN